MEREAFSKFYYAITINCFIPTITFPTRFSTLNGSIIDNILCKLSEASLTSTSGIFIDQFSDHLSCFISLDLMSPKHNYTKFVDLPDYSYDKIMKLKQTLENVDIYDKLDHNSNNDPNENYNILETTIKSAIDEAIPSKKIRFNKYKHRKSPWITNGILKSIEYRDNLYEHLKVMQPNSPEYSQSKLNLSAYNIILKNSIISAKKLYYGKCFSRYMSDIKNTYKTINSLLCKSKNDNDLPPFFRINDVMVYDKQTIAEEFNTYFTNLGPPLADEIASTHNKSFRDYLTTSTTGYLSFNYLSERDIAKIIDNFPPKTSSGHDNLSLKLVKLCKDILIKPITLIVNQMFSTGVFPDRLKLLRLSHYSKKIMNQVCKTIGLFLYYPYFQKYLKNLYTYRHVITLLRTIYSIKVNMVFIEVILRSSQLWRSLVI